MRSDGFEAEGNEALRMLKIEGLRTELFKFESSRERRRSLGRRRSDLALAG